MSDIRFSIITVTRNSGDKLKKTIDSVLQQTFTEFEIIVKDGQSTDGSLNSIPTDDRIRVMVEKDDGIYDAMNQAILLAKGTHLLFLNCGDTLYDNRVLENVAKHFYMARQNGIKSRLFYGNTYCERTKALVHSAPQITGFTCYRNIPCHQSCFYERQLFDQKKYDTSYKIRADYDHFLWCYYVAAANPTYMEVTVSSYEGGGLSEEKANRQLDKEEHTRSIKRYMTDGEIRKYQTIMNLTLAPVRRGLAENKVFSGAYNKVKEIIYR